MEVDEILVKPQRNNLFIGIYETLIFSDFKTYLFSPFAICTLNKFRCALANMVIYVLTVLTISRELISNKILHLLTLRIRI